MKARLLAALATAVAVLMPVTPLVADVGVDPGIADPALRAMAADLDAKADDHLWWGQIMGAHFDTVDQVPGDVRGVDGGGDSAIWTGHYLASQAYRYAVAKKVGDIEQQDRAKARVDQVVEALHRNINISKNWEPPSDCSPDNLPTFGTFSCGVDGLQEPGALFRNCIPEGATYPSTGLPIQEQGPGRHPMVFGPMTWDPDDDGPLEPSNWFCEDGTSRDQYAGVTFGLMAALDMVGPDDEALQHQVGTDLITMTDYLVRHGWSVVRPHTYASTRGSENFVFPLYVINPQPRLNMTNAARHAAHVLGNPVDIAKWDAIWAEEVASQAPNLTTEYLLAIQSPHNSYYNFNLNHITNFNVLRTVPEVATRQELRRAFAIIDETTRDDGNAHFETLTYGLTGEPSRRDAAVGHLRDWITYRQATDVASFQSSRCAQGLECVPQDQVHWYQDTPEGPVLATQPGSSTTLRARYPLPVVDRVKQHDFLWQRSPYELRSGGSIDPLYRPPGVDFLLPYWMLRYFEDVAPPAYQPLPDWQGPYTEAAGPVTTVDGSIGFPPDPDGPWGSMVGSLHEHSGYSDGWPGSRPETYFRNGRSHGIDFMGSGEHSDTAVVPLTANEECLPDPTVPLSSLAGTLSCTGSGDTDPYAGLLKWDATKQQAANVTAESGGTFTAFAGFEWSSDRYGHINVYFSENDANAKADGGYATMEAFWQWFTRRAEVGGGADGLATFNHPGLKQLVDEDPTQNWDDFTYVPAADERMVGIEVFNDVDEYGTDGPGHPPEGWYAHALDKGWHVGAIGAEDLGHARGDDWGGPQWAKTVILSADRSPAALRAAMLARRFYAVRDNNDGLRLSFTIDGAPMGSRLRRPSGVSLDVQASVNRPGLKLELVTSGGQVVRVGKQSTLASPVSADTGNQRYYFLRVSNPATGEIVAYSSPIWIEAGPRARSGEWLAGDLHVHTCYSHDAYCGPSDTNTGPEDFYTLSGTVGERFAEASAKGLDYLAITDHDDIRSVDDPGFGTAGVIGVGGYEGGFGGHGQVLGVRHKFPGAAVDVAPAVRAEGGAFQINHPADALSDPMDTCAETQNLDWEHGYDVVPDTVEVWNIGHLLQPPVPAGNSNDDAEHFWECFLTDGHHVGGTGGSDSHWLSTSAFQGVGNPTTWVFAPERSERGITQALREGRTSISMVPPAGGAARLLLEADADGDGVYDAMIGDTVPPGVAMRVRAEGTFLPGFVKVRVRDGDEAGRTLLDGQPLAPGGVVDFTAPEEPGWVRATLYQVHPDAPADACATFDTSYCRNQLITGALTSPIYLQAPTALTVEAPTSVHVTDPITVCAALTSSAVPLAGRTVTLTTPGGWPTATVTDGAGRACTTQTVDTDPGRLPATASFAGEPFYAASGNFRMVDVLREPTVLAYGGDLRGIGTAVNVGAVLTEHDGAPLAGRTVTFTSEGASVSAITDGTGRAAATLVVPGHGQSNLIVVEFAGQRRFAPSTTAATITWGSG